jgi:hypothetical protein
VPAHPLSPSSEGACRRAGQGSAKWVIRLVVAIILKNVAYTGRFDVTESLEKMRKKKKD